MLYFLLCIKGGRLPSASREPTRAIVGQALTSCQNAVNLLTKSLEFRTQIADRSEFRKEKMCIGRKSTR